MTTDPPLVRIERIAAGLSDLTGNTGNGEVDELMSYALSHVKYAIKVLKGE